MKTLFPTDPIGLQYRKTDPDTSREAAAKHEASGRAETNRLRVLGMIQEKPGLTSAEIAANSGIDRHEAAKRCSDLERYGFVRKGDRRPCTTNGNQMVTWWPIK